MHTSTQSRFLGRAQKCMTNENNCYFKVQNGWINYNTKNIETLSEQDSF